MLSVWDRYGHGGIVRYAFGMGCVWDKTRHGMSCVCYRYGYVWTQRESCMLMVWGRYGTCMDTAWYANGTGHVRDMYGHGFTYVSGMG